MYKVPICKDTQLCAWLNKKSCDDCVVKKMPDREKSRVLENFDVTLSHLPDHIDDIFGEECQFCIENPPKRECYTKIELVHPEPYSETGAFFGFGPKTRNKIGSFLQLDISCCGRCKSIIKKHAYVKRTVFLAFCGLGILSLIMRLIFTENTPEWAVMPLIIVSICAVTVNAIVSKAYIKRHHELRKSIFEIPLVGELRQRGWSLLDTRASAAGTFSLRSSDSRTNGFGRLKSK